MSHVRRSKTQVLIVGARAAGSTLAHEFGRRGIHYRLIDKAPGPSRLSRGFTGHPRLIEHFMQAGLDADLIASGRKAGQMAWYFPGRHDVHAAMDFAALTRTKYPFTLIIGQDRTEQVLYTRLAERGYGDPEWNRELVSFTENEWGVTATVVEPGTAGSEQEVIEADWLVGCDGWQSPVRHMAQIPVATHRFTGQRMRFMEVPELRGFDYPDDRVHYFVHPDNMLLIARLPHGWYRVLVSDMSDTASSADTTRDIFQAILDRHFGRDAVLLGEPDPATCSAFRLQHAMSELCRKGRVALAGDARCVLSPAAGQGLNSAMGDAFDLGWRLALVLDGANPNLLDGYGERQLVGKQVQQAQLEIQKVIMDHGTPVDKRIAISQQPGFQQDVTGVLSGIDLTYRDANPTAGLPFADNRLMVGDRAPDAPITTYDDLHDRLRNNPRHTLVVLQRDPGDYAATALRAGVEQHLNRWVDTVAISAPGHGYRAGVTTADTDELHTLYGADNTARALLIRPDGNIALLADINGRTDLFRAVRAAIGR